MTADPWRERAPGAFAQGWEVVPLLYWPSEAEKAAGKTTKTLLASGVTGREGTGFTSEELNISAAGDLTYYRQGVQRHLRWREQRNYALRMPVGVIGIDVDAYNNKRGGDTLAEKEHRFGPLPATCVLTSRTDHRSGIRLFQIPEGVLLRDVGGDVETIQRHHRYAAGVGSLHHTRATYGCFRSDTWQPMVLCRPEELPWLPTAWVDHLQAPVGERLRPVALGGGEVGAWIQEHSGRTLVVKARFSESAVYNRHLKKGSRNGALYTAMLAVLRDARRGSRNADQAIDGVWAAHCVACDDRNPRLEEYERAVPNAVSRVSSEERGTWV